MKTIVLLAISLFFSAMAFSQDKHNGNLKNKPVEAAVTSAMETDAGTLDRLQRETEDISVMKPILFIAAIIDDRLALRRMEKESIADAKSRETGSR